MKSKVSSHLVIESLLFVVIAGFGFIKNDRVEFLNPAAIPINNCDYYFDSQNGYTSIYDINQDLYNETLLPSYKTWGTVTKAFVDSGSNYNFYIQSTDANQNVSGILIYSSSRSDIYEGYMVTITGSVTLYNNLPEFNNPTITIDYTSNPFPVTTYETDAAFWTNGTNASSSEFLAGQAMGTRRLSIHNQTLQHLSLGNAQIVIGSVVIPLYFNNLSNTNAINNKSIALNGQLVDVTGYLHCYINSSSGTTKMQLLLRDENNLNAAGATNDMLELNSQSGYSIGYYSTGNYDSVTLQGVDYEHYRAVNLNNGLMSLLPYFSDTNDGTAPGSFYNTSAISDIQSITIDYYTDLSSGIKPTLTYGPTPLYGVTVNLDFALSSTQATILMDDVNYFMIETSVTTLHIESLTIEYLSGGGSPSFDYQAANSSLYRINPIVYNGALYNGASVSVPTSITRDGNMYEVATSKTYTYYTYDYVAINPSFADEASQTEPADVAAYYTAFKTWPANYVIRDNYDAAYTIFGDDTRCVSTYYRTDGYMTSIPYQDDGYGTPTYHELDIALVDSYYNYNRGVGRVVCLEYGFDQNKGATGYDSAPVCIYTDDHYATFQEYLNTGAYGTRFNSEKNRTPYIWGPATTLLPIS